MKCIYTLTVFFLIICCAPIYKNIVEKEYSQEKITGATLVIAPFRNLTVGYSGNVKDEFGEGNTKKLILEHFQKTLKTNMTDMSTFSNVIYDDYKEPYYIKPVKLEMGDIYDLYVKIPKDTTTFQFKTITPDFILFIQDLQIGTENLPPDNMFGQNKSNQNIPSGYADNSFKVVNFSGYQGVTLDFQPPGMSIPTPVHNMHNQTMPTDKYLRYKCGFFFWDNQKHKIVVYGKIFAKAKADSYGLGMVKIVRMTQWEQVDIKFINSLIRGTPFQR